MTKLSNALMALVGAAGAGVYIACLVFSGAFSSLTSLPVLLMVFVVAALLASIPLLLTPVYALVAGGGGATKAKKPKKKDKKAAAADESGDDEYAEGFDDDIDSSTSGSFDDDDMVAESETFDSMPVDDDDFMSDDEVSESGVAGMIDDSAQTMGDDDPFDISDSFESDVTNVDLALDSAESFDNQFELGPESGIDFDDEDEKNA